MSRIHVTYCKQHPVCKFCGTDCFIPVPRRIDPGQRKALKKAFGSVPTHIPTCIKGSNFMYKYGVSLWTLRRESWRKGKVACSIGHKELIKLADEAKEFIDLYNTKGYAAAHYLTRRETAVPIKWVDGDDLNEYVASMLYWPFYFLTKKIGDETNMDDFFVHIIPNYQDPSAVIVTYGNIVIVREWHKAWNFYFDSMLEFGEFLADKKAEMLKKLRIVAPLDAALKSVFEMI